MIIDGREIGPRHSPYIVAEISGNHNGSLATAIQLIKAAKDCGADAVKAQAYTADTITLDCDSDEFMIHEGPWKGQNLHDLYKKTQTPFEWFPDLSAAAKEIGITWFASVFDKSSVDMLEKLDCPAYKIASMEIVDIPLIEYAASTNKPIILSTGMATDDEVCDAMWACCKHQNPPVVLHCVSGYPTSPADFNLRKIDTSSSLYGISDHTQGVEIPIAATTLGACLIEKHLMVGNENTEDYAFSETPLTFETMVKAVRNIWQAMQPPRGDPEQASRQLRRSLYVVNDIAKGEKFTEENVRSIRPSYGMAPKELPWVLSRIAAVDLKRGMALKPDHIS